MEQIDVGTKGFVRLVDSMPRDNLDGAIVQAARVSYAGGTTTSRSDEGLIRYLLRHWHNTPFEMVEFKFHIKMPIYIARQHLRHRTASVNELSGRYSVMPTEYFTPPEFRKQSQTNKQSSEGVLDTVDPSKINTHCEESFSLYNELLDQGCCRELARAHLPLSTYTEFYWKINLHNLMHYLQLRMEAGAQQEIQEYARAMYDLIKEKVPYTMKAFSDFRLNIIQLSGVDIECIRTKTLPNSPGEKRELLNKLKILGLENYISL